MWVKLNETLSLDVFCQTECISMLRNELIQKEMVECSLASKSMEQKHKNKDYLKHSIYSLLQYLVTKLHVCLFCIESFWYYTTNFLGWQIIKRNYINELKRAAY